MNYIIKENKIILSVENKHELVEELCDSVLCKFWDLFIPYDDEEEELFGEFINKIENSIDKTVCEYLKE